MSLLHRLATIAILLPFASNFGLSYARGEKPIIKVWPAAAPGVNQELTPRIKDESRTTLVAGEPIQLLTDISSPELVYFRANSNSKSPAIVICPGGGHNLLAYDLEGTELAHWFNKQGVNAAVLKYRVPSTHETFRGLPALQDAQRAMRVVRSQAAELGIDPNKIGIMGFSAGGEVAARVSLQSHLDHYDKIDGIDEIDSKPNFSMLIYPAYLVEGEELKKELDPRKLLEPSSLPPFFMVHTWDDPVSPLNCICLAKALKLVNRPCELHLFDRGGHGYGIRHIDNVPVTDWTSQAEKWLKVNLSKPQ